MRHFRNSEGAYGPRPDGDRTRATAVAMALTACAGTVRAIARAVLLGLGIFLAGGALAGLGMPQAALAQSGTGRDTTAPVDLLATIDTGGQDEDEDGADDAVDADDPVTETAGLTGDGDADPAVELQVSEPEILFDVNRVGVRLSRNQARGLKNNLWRGTPASRAAQLVSGGLATSASASINALAHASVALLATPPEGTTNELMDLLRARLGWLQSAGRSDDLATLVDQVPDSGEWIEWKRWLVETQLMSRRDSQACGYVSEQAKRSLDEFWQKSEVICRISQGDSQSARFALDAFGLLGIDDPVFDTLVNVLLYDRDPGLIDSSLLVPLHVVLMDAAHLSIGLGGIEALAEGSVQSAISLRYLDRDARLVSTLRALSLGLIDHDRAANLWRLVEFERQDTAAAVARHQSRATELTRARAWRALAKDRTPVRLPLVAAALVTDIQNGAGNLMLPLYADLVREALDFRGAPEYVLSEDEQIRAILGFILAVSDNRPIPDFLNHPDGRAAREIMDMQETGKWDAAPIERLGVWQLLPLLEVITSGETRTRTSDARDERSSRRGVRDDGARTGALTRRIRRTRRTCAGLSLRPRPMWNPRPMSPPLRSCFVRLTRPRPTAMSPRPCFLPTAWRACQGLQAFTRPMRRAWSRRFAPWATRTRPPRFRRRCFWPICSNICTARPKSSAMCALALCRYGRAQIPMMPAVPRFAWKARSAGYGEARAVLAPTRPRTTRSRRRRRA